MKITAAQQAFFALLRAGLWEQSIQLPADSSRRFKAVVHMADMQSVQGLIVAGLENLSDRHLSEQLLDKIVNRVLYLERRNKETNQFVEWVISRLKEESIFALLVKGQGIALCYERPQWRSCGDVDLLLDPKEYQRAIEILLPLANSSDPEDKYIRHKGMMMNGKQIVEVHGSMRTRLDKGIDAALDRLQAEAIRDRKIRIWHNGNTDIPLPAPDIDIIFLFTHILHHFYLDGVGLRQVCDWCRFIWCFRDQIDRQLLENRLQEMGLMSEWRTFAALAVNWLGMPAEAMPLYEDLPSWSHKADRVLSFILRTGNFGISRHHHNSRNHFLYKVQSFWRKTRDFANHLFIFPRDSVKFYCYFLSIALFPRRAVRRTLQ